jgi:hypothetical protein
MTGRQSLLAVIAGDQVDRVPVAPFIHTNFVHAFFGSIEADPVARTGEVYDHFGLDIIHRNCTPSHDEIGQSTSLSRRQRVDPASNRELAGR